ncbi:MAG: hypothetical protein CFE35_09710 [Novosphingobium sp. PASSN1]|nr:MAG: hypothetical protein CFE35_09710 [Novosphingobium sp. PASSN1]
MGRTRAGLAVSSLAGIQGRAGKLTPIQCFGSAAGTRLHLISRSFLPARLPWFHGRAPAKKRTRRRYMRLALKAQAACRSTLEALARLHQPREQTVKHVHVSEGGQAVRVWCGIRPSWFRLSSFKA